MWTLRSYLRKNLRLAGATLPRSGGAPICFYFLFLKMSTTWHGYSVRFRAQTSTCSGPERAQCWSHRLWCSVKVPRAPSHPRQCSERALLQQWPVSLSQILWINVEKLLLMCQFVRNANPFGQHQVHLSNSLPWNVHYAHNLKKKSTINHHHISHCLHTEKKHY